MDDDLKDDLEEEELPLDDVDDIDLKKKSPLDETESVDELAEEEDEVDPFDDLDLT